MSTIIIGLITLVATVAIMYVVARGGLTTRGSRGDRDERRRDSDQDG